jgi:glycosyltransferase involved in cell wall biosynthesis
MTPTKVLLISHNHPKLLAGGVEVYMAGLYEELRASPEFEPMILARAGKPFTPTDALHEDSPFAMVDADPNQYLLYTDIDDFDYFGGTLRTSKDVLSQHFRDFLLSHRPDVVHFQHTAYLGYDMVRIARNTLPDAAIVYSLHEYLPICHRNGQMVRTKNDELCELESPRRCNECFPDITPQDFFMRKLFAKANLGLVDCFTTPSEYVKQRYVDWGIPASRIVVKGYPAQPRTGMPRADARARNRFAYFGQLNPYKGADVMLRAMDMLGEDFDGHLWIWGANLEKQSPVWRERFEELLAVERDTVTFAGEYGHGELAKLMQRIDWVIVPSIWWETGPIVVWEAFQHGRPVICSDIGGMSEKVNDGVNGLHFRTGNPEDLAAAMQRAVDTPGLWDQLHAGIPAQPGHSMSQDVGILSGIYAGALRDRRGDAPARDMEGASVG